jgi:hypothetical protein
MALRSTGRGLRRTLRLNAQSRRSCATPLGQSRLRFGQHSGLILTCPRETGPGAAALSHDGDTGLKLVQRHKLPSTFSKSHNHKNKINVEEHFI